MDTDKHGYIWIEKTLTDEEVEEFRKKWEENFHGWDMGKGDYTVIIVKKVPLVKCLWNGLLRLVTGTGRTGWRR